MSDLQCPATFLVLADEPLGADEHQLGRVAGELRGRRVAKVLASPSMPQLERAARIAERLGVTYEPAPGLDEGGLFRRAVEDAADLYRGEAVLLVAPAEVVRIALGLAAAPAPGEVVELQVDGDGWLVRHGESGEKP
ncbi:MAG TPA: hypothetical protein VFX33_04740 [Actinomycetales bacterium]|nr:hypothetical protein [Actinomycetales bacterium]